MVLSTLFRSQHANPRQEGTYDGFSLDPDVIRTILECAMPLGHNESTGDLNLGFGFLYYALARSLRPAHVVVIGSGFGFSVVCLGLALRDNRKGRLSFVDPSYSVLSDGPLKTIGGTGQWDDPAKVKRHFERFGLDGIVTHFRQRSDQFFRGYAEAGLPEIDIGFIDGSHAYNDVRHDFVSSLVHSHRNTYLLMHDTNIYLRELVRHAGVKRWLKSLAREKELFEVVDFPFSSGVAIVRVLEEDAWEFMSPSAP
jgi:hypothetical protein